MRSLQAVVAILMAVMVNMAHSSPGFHATSVILATALVDVVTSSGFQHSVITAPGSTGPIHVESSHLMHHRKNDTGGCFHSSNHTGTEKDTSAWIPWTALASENEPTAQLALSDTISALCKRLGATIFTRGIPYTHCELNDYTNGTYAVIAQMTYLGPKTTFDMRGLYEYCRSAVTLTEYCEYGGVMDIDLDLGGPDGWQSWNVQARPIVGPCPDCTGGLLGGGGRCRGC